MAPTTPDCTPDPDDELELEKMWSTQLEMTHFTLWEWVSSYAKLALILGIPIVAVAALMWWLGGELP